MGFIKAIAGAMGGALADQWLEVLEPDNMGEGTVFTSAVPARKDGRRGSNRKGSEDLITDGSVIHVYDNQCMLLIDGGKIIDYTTEPGYYQVDNQSAPSLFNGDFGEALKESFDRLQYGGMPAGMQKTYYINLQEITGIKFGTRNPINYFDNFYNSELFLRAHGSYSIKIIDPIKFYAEAVPRNMNRLEIRQINEQYMDEFLDALQSAINRMSSDGVRISHVTGHSRELSRYMSTALDDEWRQMRGIEIQSVGLASISYDEESQKLINMRNQGAMLSDPLVREGYVQGSAARGMEAAGSNAGGAMQGFMGVGMGMQAGSIGQFSQINQAQMQQAAGMPAQGWRCGCGHSNPAEARFCSACGQPATDGGPACTRCGRPIEAGAQFCANCGQKL